MSKLRVLEIFPYHDFDEVLNFVENEGGEFAPHHFWLFDQMKKNGYDIACVEANKSSWLRKLGKKLWIGNLEQQINCWRKSKDFDFIFDPAMEHTIFLALLKILKLYNKPIISVSQRAREIRAKGLLRRWKQYMVRYIYYKGTDLILFFNKPISEESNRNPIKPNYKTLNSWGVDFDFFQSYIEKEKEPSRSDYIFTTGGSGRDFESLVRAFQKIDYKLKITTQGTFSEHLEKMRTPNVIVDNSIIPGLSSTGAIRKDYYHSLAVAVPLLSIEDNNSFAPWGITVVLEALSMGKPVIVTENESYPFDVEKEGVGIKIPYKDVEAWRQAVQYLIDNPDEAREMGQRGVQLCKNKYNYNLFAKEVIGHIDDYFNVKREEELIPLQKEFS